MISRIFFDFGSAAFDVAFGFEDLGQVIVVVVIVVAIVVVA